jgi:hypothetical protein
MMKTIRAILILALSSGLSVASEGVDLDAAPWLKPRSMENFKSLLQRSPFSLPTAEENTAAPDRFSLTGVATIDEKPVVFVFDKNTQNRLMLQKMEGTENQSRDHLVELFANSDPKNVRASVQIEGQRSEIHFAENAFTSPAGQPMPQPAPAPGHPIPPGPQPPQPPQAPANAQQPAVQPGANPNSQQPRRVIRRRVISGQAPSAQPVPGQ